MPFDKALISAMRNLKDIERSNCQSYRETYHIRKTLNLSQLHKIFKRDVENGLRAAFSLKDFEGQAKVSSTEQVLDLFFPKRVNYFS